MNLYKIKEKIRQNKFIYPIVFRIIMRRSEAKRKIEGKNNKLINLVATYKLRYNIKGNDNKVEVGKGTKLTNLQIVIIGDNNRIIIGDYTDIKSGVFWLQGNNCLLQIGNNVSVEGCQCAVAEDDKQIVIGDNCLLSYGIELKTSDSHSIIDNTTGERINPAQSIEIGSHVWIGANATILKGVKIADNAIIGTSALVTKDVPANVAVGGNPARILKDDISWDHKIIN